MKPTSIRELFREQTNILDMVMRFDLGLDLVPEGPYWRGSCPFNELHFMAYRPFYVYPDKQMFKCTSCSSVGDAFDFLVKAGGLTVDEAKDWLSRECGIPVETIWTEKQCIDAAIEKLEESIKSQTGEILRLVAMCSRWEDTDEEYVERVLKRLKAETGLNLQKLRNFYESIKLKYNASRWMVIDLPDWVRRKSQ